MSALRMQGVGLDYPGHPGALQDVALQVPQGRMVVLRGRSGSGKSSLLAVAAGLQAPDRGRVAVMGEPMPHEAGKAARLRARHIGLVFQHLHLLPELSAAENVELPLRLRRVPRDRCRARVEALMPRFGIDRLRDRLPHTLSGGEQQRVAIARALASEPALLLVDEPTSSLDEENAREVRAALEQAAQLGAGVLVATHDPVFNRASPTLRIHGGRVSRA